MERAVAVAIGLAATFCFLGIVVAAIVEPIATVINLEGPQPGGGAGGDDVEAAVGERAGASLADVGERGVGHRMVLLEAPVVVRAEGLFANAMIAKLEELRVTVKDGKQTASEAYTALIESVPAGPLRVEAKKQIDGCSRCSSARREDQVCVEEWFDAGMERLEGRLPAQHALITRVVAVTLVLALNANAVVMADALWNDPAARHAATSFAPACRRPATRRCRRTPARPAPRASRPSGDLKASPEQEIALLLGWADGHVDQARSHIWLWALGFVLSVAAIGLGAPFWFDCCGDRPGHPADGARAQELRYMLRPVEAVDPVVEFQHDHEDLNQLVRTSARWCAAPARRRACRSRRRSWWSCATPVLHFAREEEGLFLTSPRWRCPISPRRSAPWSPPTMWRRRGGAHDPRRPAGRCGAGAGAVRPLRAVLHPARAGERNSAAGLWAPAVAGPAGGADPVVARAVRSQ
jgi:hypothetical protein